MTHKKTELEILMQGMPDERLDRLLEGIGISRVTMYRWFREGDLRKRITITSAPVIKKHLDAYYGRDVDMNELCQALPRKRQRATAA